MAAPKYKRILLKLSGEALMGDQEFGIDPKVLGQYAEEIRLIHDLGVQIGIVIGGGNIYRGIENSSDGVDSWQRDRHDCLHSRKRRLFLSDSHSSGCGDSG